MAPKNNLIMVVGTIAIFAFIFLALTLGMGDWRATPPATASMPAPSSTH